MRRTAQIATGVAVLCLAIPVRAQAEPVVITAGFLLSTGVFEISPPSSVSGTDGFRVDTVLAVDRGQLNFFGFCLGGPECTPGKTMSIGGLLGTAFGDSGLIDTVVSLRGVDYDDFSFIDGSDLQFRLTGEVIAPPFDGPNDVTVTAPFSLAGVFTDPLGRATQIIGRGTATARFARSGAGGWSGSRIQYDFADTSTVPEPSTMLLFGSGMSALFAAGRRRRAARSIRVLSSCRQSRRRHP